MNVEVRDDSVIISGYVNAVERFSKPIKEPLRGKVRTFIERIRAGVFRNALKRNNSVKVLLNHNKKRELANTEDGTATLVEDNIGLRAEVTITDKEVIEKAKQNKLVGWSFGFYANSDEIGTEGDIETRTITDLDLDEVSILDDTKSPAYYGTSISARNAVERFIEYREVTIESLEKEAKEKHKIINQVNYENIEEQHQRVENEKKEKQLELFAEIVANKVIEKLKDINGTGEKKTIPNPVLVDKGQRATDIFSYNERIRKLEKNLNI